MFHPAEMPLFEIGSAYRLKFECEARPKLLLGYNVTFFAVTLNSHSPGARGDASEAAGEWRGFAGLVAIRPQPNTFSKTPQDKTHPRS